MSDVVETLNELERRIQLQVPAAKLDTETDARIQEIAKTAKIDGFRPGKVSKAVVQQRFGRAARAEAADKLIREVLTTALQEQGTKMVGNPTIEVTQDNPGSDLEFYATFEVYPDITVADLTGFTIEKANAEVTESDIDNSIELLMKQRANWVAHDGSAESGHRVKIDFAGTIDGESFDGGTAEGFDLELGKNAMIPGFEDPILGAKVGDKVAVDTSFPEDYHAKDLAGKAVHFDVTIQSLEKPEVPVLDETMIKSLGVDDGNIDTLKKEVRNHMEQELARALKSRMKEQVLEQLDKAHAFEVPKALLADEQARLHEQTKQRFRTQGLPDMPDMPLDMYTQTALRRVRLGLLMNEIIVQNEITEDEAKVKAYVEGIAASYDDPEEVVGWLYKNDKLLAEAKTVVLEEQVVDWVVEQAKVVEKDLSFNQVVHAEEQ